MYSSEDFEQFDIRYQAEVMPRVVKYPGLLRQEYNDVDRLPVWWASTATTGAAAA